MAALEGFEPGAKPQAGERHRFRQPSLASRRLPGIVPAGQRLRENLAVGSGHILVEHDAGDADRTSQLLEHRRYQILSAGGADQACSSMHDRLQDGIPAEVILDGRAREGWL